MENTTDIPSYPNNIVFKMQPIQKTTCRGNKKLEQMLETKGTYTNVDTYMYIYICMHPPTRAQMWTGHESGRQPQFARACTGKDSCGLHKDAFFPIRAPYRADESRSGARARPRSPPFGNSLRRDLAVPRIQRGRQGCDGVGNVVIWGCSGQLDR